MFRNLKKYSVSYTNLNPNFCISKVKKVGGDISYADKSVVAVVRNILNRGNLVSASSFLRGNLGMEQRAQTPLYSFDEERVSWNSVIRGAVDFNPAQEFYEKYGLKDLKMGEEKVISHSKDGLISQGFLNYYDKEGQFVKSKKIRETTYNPTKEVVVKKIN